VTVINKEFPTQQLKTSSSTASIRSDDNQIALVEAFKRGREISHNQPLWTGPFLQPVGGRISTEYGVIRYTNDAVESSRHNGIDFAIESGTPVVATETGYVRLSEHIAITGNTIFIDHGVGIFSQYYHLNSMDVNVGDFVEKGDIIGTVGSTGFSTGPHLHFSMYNNNIYVNPWKFFDAPPF
jgi:murein DD-endopeptidase MepM/ murein hydrolase activator NlpD